MKSEREVNTFKAEIAKRVYNCKRCNGDIDNTRCPCVRRFNFETQAYEACIPKDFWRVKPDEITFNRTAFERFVAPYVARLKVAHRRGYGLCFSGSNGVGKSMFISYILASAIHSGKTAYYTTMLQLDHDIKAGFGDKEAASRLDWMLTSDFLALDEMGKEQFRALGENTFTKTQVERILKQRFDESKPVLIATNLSMLGLGKAYGDTILSMVRGKMQNVKMEAGDVRISLSSKMRTDMGFCGSDEGADEA
jgi:DNA replication protein DnaC